MLTRVGRVVVLQDLLRHKNVQEETVFAGAAISRVFTVRLHPITATCDALQSPFRERLGTLRSVRPVRDGSISHGDWTRGLEAEFVRGRISITNVLECVESLGFLCRRQ